MLLLHVLVLALFNVTPFAFAYKLPNHHPIRKAPASLIARIAHSNPASLRHDDHPVRPFAANGLRITPASMGADPTGRKDSWPALNAAIHVCLNQSAISPNGFFPGEDSTPQFGPIRDMGGCDIDLEGGEYRISKPLKLPEMNANMQFGHGSLVASPDFVGDFLFVVGVKDSCSVPQVVAVAHVCT